MQKLSILILAYIFSVAALSLPIQAESILFGNQIIDSSMLRASLEQTDRGIVLKYDIIKWGFLKPEQFLTVCAQPKSLDWKVSVQAMSEVLRSLKANDGATDESILAKFGITDCKSEYLPH